ncbi:SDR family oxidoreductase [Bacillus sp. 165]|uniref:SDR family NAD(P)-dependent oxidoreductase n=1 Tax=Bacillus sp. 165 TaxID=1529117 RepID=UPI001ADD3B13|nr:SDR family oxidoreductase [Bacillus sp. 165]MBO9130557.1 SDR family oxidoreductase [Bacillus sp. 165]
MKNHETAFITGASDGIGKELAYHFAKDGYNLVLVARSEQKMIELKQNIEKAYNVHVTIISKDISDQEAVKEIYEEVQKKGITIDYLVNNAGFGLFGEFVNTDINAELNMIDLNIKTVTHFTKLFLPHMVERNKGRVLNVASTAAFQPGPLMAVYYATKSYVLSFTEALENELKGTNVTVTAFCPGATKTEFSSRANLGKSKLFKSGVMDVKDVAEIGYKGFMDGKTVVISGMKNRLTAAFVRFMPRKIVTSIVRSVQEEIDTKN